MGLDNVRIVLVRPRGAANAGAVARVMKNMGLRHLVLVRPRFRQHFWARAMAVHAADVLEGARVCDSVAEAVADCGLVAGTTCRRGLYRPARHTPRSAVSDLLHAAGSNQVALVFGPEDHGLSNKDLQLCQLLLTIPSHEAYPSLNLAQAVAICCYELFVSEVGAGATNAGAQVLASSASTEMMYQRLQDALLSIGFLLRDNPEHIMYAIRGMLGRARLEEREVRILLGLARQIEWWCEANARRESASAGASRKRTNSPLTSA